jgi:1-acyl-sn-glycerol-3-phosphate acyltransferase
MIESQRPSGLLWAAYEYFVMVFGLGLLALICLLWLPFAMILYPLLPRKWGEFFGRRFITYGFRFYLRCLEIVCAFHLDLDELDQLRNEGPLILAANHPSLMDAGMLASRLPNTVCVMKAALMDNLLFGSAARLARYIRNNAPLETILSAREELRGGAHLVIFPEGTRTQNFPVDPCQKSTGLISSRTGTPVQTLLIECSTPYLGKDWPLFQRPALPLRVRVRLGRRFAPPKDVSAFTRELDAYFSQELGKKSGANSPSTVIDDIQSPLGNPR